jgi:hypothetical protein
MEGYITGTSFCEVRDDAINRINHEVYVDRCFDAVVSQRIANHRADRQVGHEVVIHDIKMDDVSACVQDSFDIFTQSSEIG